MSLEPDEAAGAAAAFFAGAVEEAAGAGVAEGDDLAGVDAVDFAADEVEAAGAAAGVSLGFASSAFGSCTFLPPIEMEMLEALGCSTGAAAGLDPPMLIVFP